MSFRFITILFLLGILIIIGFATGELRFNHTQTKCVSAQTEFTGWGTLIRVGSVEVRWPSWNSRCLLEFDKSSGDLNQLNGVPASPTSPTSN